MQLSIMPTYTILLALVLFCGAASAQNPYLKNPSFEDDYPGLHKSPKDWEPCKDHSTPDTGPAFNGEQQPSHGKTYLHMVTRGSGNAHPHTTEACQTKLLIPLNNNECYKLKLDLSHSANTSFTTESGFTIVYGDASRLKIWGGSYSCEMKELLWESESISHTNWVTYDVVLHPLQGDVNYLILEADYNLNSAYGNVCIDNLQLEPLTQYSVKLSEKITRGETVHLQAGAGSNYQWEPQQWLSCTDCPNPAASPEKSVAYKVIITTEKDCQYEEIFIIQVETTVFVANIFSPNGDGNNDEVFTRISGNDLARLSFSIFDRWGNKVFETTDPTIGWDGTKAGQRLNPGVYSYMTNVKTAAGEDIVKSGSITLVR